ncbi:hypothetical protein LXL04_011178 [Taraxacum kok-saghyz]
MSLLSNASSISPTIKTATSEAVEPNLMDEEVWIFAYDLVDVIALENDELDLSFETGTPMGWIQNFRLKTPGVFRSKLERKSGLKSGAFRSKLERLRSKSLKTTTPVPEFEGALGQYVKVQIREREYFIPSFFSTRTTPKGVETLVRPTVATIISHHRNHHLDRHPAQPLPP